MISGRERIFHNSVRSLTTRFGSTAPLFKKLCNCLSFHIPNAHRCINYTSRFNYQYSGNYGHNIVYNEIKIFSLKSINRSTHSKSSPTESKIEKMSIDAQIKEPEKLPLSIKNACDDLEIELKDVQNLRWKSPKYVGSQIYPQLAKYKLSMFVILSQLAGCALAPSIVSLPIILYTTLGTSLCVASANIINQWIEAPYDAQMARTRTRNLVTHTIAPDHVFRVGVLCGLSGIGILSVFTNPVCAFLGGINILLYTLAYTPLKRISIVNTWIGAIVGAIPPMIGWSACTGGSLDLGAWVLGALLYAWQFPHFNSLSWNLRMDYSKAGYRMMAVTDPNLNVRVSLRYSLLMFPLLGAAAYIGMTSPWILLDGGLVNAVLTYRAFQFWKSPSSSTARKLFFVSLLHLPLILAFLILHKIRTPKDSEQSVEKEDNEA